MDMGVARDLVYEPDLLATVSPLSGHCVAWPDLGARIVTGVSRLLQPSCCTLSRSCLPGNLPGPGFQWPRVFTGCFPPVAQLLPVVGWGSPGLPGTAVVCWGHHTRSQCLEHSWGAARWVLRSKGSTINLCSFLCMQP